MEFLTRLRETPESIRSTEKMKEAYENSGFKFSFEVRMMEGIRNEAGYTLSIQASSGHYSHPRAVVALEEYAAMEVAVKDPAGNFVPLQYVTKDKKLIKAFDEYSDGTVFGFVPVELIEKLYQDAFKQEEG